MNQPIYIPTLQHTIRFINISGRNFDYENALRIIQDEEYLEDSDFDDIKKHYKLIKKRYYLESNTNHPKDTKTRGWLT